MKIIGDGLIANAFKAVNDNTESVIFAAGVSKSNSTNLQDFCREEELLQNTLSNTPKTQRFVYFGTCSVYDSDRINDAYVLHKQRLESMVLTRETGVVCRLPQVSGKNASDWTLISYLFKHIEQKKKIDIWRFARRNIIDVNDMAAIVFDLLSKETISNNIYNIAATKDYSVHEIVILIEEILDTKANYNLLDKGSSYEIDLSDIKKDILDYDNLFKENYLKSVLLATRA